MSEEIKKVEPAANNKVAVTKNITDRVLEKVTVLQEGKMLHLPKDYSAANALKAAYLILVETTAKNGQPVLQYCTEASIANALLKMVVLGLNPIKKQCDFIAYDKKLSCDIEYTANIAIAKRHGMKDIFSNTIYKGDVFEYAVDGETGRRKIIKHEQTLESLRKDGVVGAYAVVTMDDGTKHCTIMSIEQIKDAWSMGGAKGASPAHMKFPDQMAEKTVINRACKPIIRGSDDAGLLTDDDEIKDVARETLAEKSKTANTQSLEFSEEASTDTMTDRINADIEVATEVTDVAPQKETPQPEEKPKSDAPF